MPTSPERTPPIIPGFDRLLHGADYSPEQWDCDPAILDEDFALMREAGLSSVSIGIFSWSALEPEEGRFAFDWFDDVMDRVARAGMKAVVATPSAARPLWLAQQYREVLRVDGRGLRERPAARHNHCPTSPIYREKVAAINTRLAARYADHPALGLWHISNEYGGDCYCPLCIEAFQHWLRRRYGTLEAFNRAWWSGFWSHQVTDWRQVHPHDYALVAVRLDWRRFMSDQVLDFMQGEISAVRRHSTAPVTTNFMGAFPDYNYFDHARPLDVVAWDWYPNYGDRDAMHRLAVRESFTHELMRGVGGGKPWMLMESSPSNTNWFNPQKLKAPGQHALECLQAIAHGADTVQYFQWRKSLGGCEQFHGAVVDHAGHGGTRVFREVAAVGEMLAKLAPVRGTRPDAEVAIVYDPEVRWALEGGVGHGDAQKDYVGQAAAHYLPLWRRGLGVDVVRSAASLEGYKLAIAPMVHMLLPGVAESWRRYVEGGGVLLATYLTGYVGPSTLCLRGGWPGAGLRELFGVWNEEIDTLFDDMPQGVKLRGGALTGAPEVLSAGVYCERLHAESAEILGVYTEQFYAGEPALTRRPVGDRGGQAWYLGTRLDEPGLDGLTATLLDEAGVTPVLPEPAPEGVMARRRIAGDEGYLFLLNFKRDRQTVAVGHVGGADLLTGEAVGERFELPGYGGAVIATARSSAR